MAERELLRDATLAAPASPEAIETAEAALGCQLPGDYKEFLRFSNGAEGPVEPEGDVVLWRVESLVSGNQRRRVPGLVVFGTDGAGELYGFDMRGPSRIVMMPAMSSDWADAIEMGTTFVEFLHRVGTMWPTKDA